jgi:predicted dehydrogenase
MKNEIIRCAVIGLGVGASHVKGYTETPEAKLVAIVDTDPKRLEKHAETVGKDNCFTDYKTMLKTVQPDLVSVALPNFLHAPVSIDCLKAGAHVLCEKPMAMNIGEARKMIAVAKSARRKLGINLSYRFSAAARALKEMADGGFLGQPYHALTFWTRRDGFPGFGSWFGQKKLSGGGPLIDLGVHRIDLAMWLMGNPEPVAVSGMTHHHIGVPRGKASNKLFDVEDLSAGFVRFKNGASLLFEISWGGHQAEPERMSTTVMGTKGTLIHRNEGGGYNFVGEYFTTFGTTKLNGRVAGAEGQSRSSMASMVESISTGAPLVASAEDGLRIQRVLDGLYKSAQMGKEVRV